MITESIARVLLYAVLALTFLSPASAEEPLVQPGKQTLHQRVLTRPGARLAKTPDMVGKPGNSLLQAFSRFYVYERMERNGKTWLRIGADTQGKNILGWVAEGHTVPWKQQLTLALTNPGAVRDRLLFFHDWEPLKSVLDSPEPAQVTRPIIEKLESGGSDPRIAALEPETFRDIRERFYLLPVLDHVQVLSGTGELVRALKIASVSEHDPDAAPAATPVARPEPPPAAEARQYRAAVVFVIDSTISMGPYIEETKAAVEQVYERLREAQVLDRVGFGLVAFRAETDSTRRNRDLRYVSRAFVDPSKVRDAGAFLRRISDLREARVPTQFFDEDALAGVITALDETDWEDFDARYLVLITDAGTLDGSTVAGGGPAVESVTGLDISRVASIAGEKQVAITVFHLKTPEGASNHYRAERQYRELARNARFQTEAYLPIDAGSVRDFRRAVDALAEAIIANVSQQDDTGRDHNPVRPVVAAASGGDTAENIREIANALGHAMRLRYLGKVADARVPTLFESWISDRDFADPSKSTVEVRVLLTKSQLSDLQMIVQKIVNAAEAGMLRPDSFFDSLRSLAAQFGRDPNLATDRQATRLADLGLLDEYLEGMPYQSQVMTLSQETWSAWGPQKQREFINGLKRKLRQYARYNEEWDSWVNLAQTADASGEWVYPVPLADMP